MVFGLDRRRTTDLVVFLTWQTDSSYSLVRRGRCKSSRTGCERPPSTLHVCQTDLDEQRRCGESATTAQTKREESSNKIRCCSEVGVRRLDRGDRCPDLRRP